MPPHALDKVLIAEDRIMDNGCMRLHKVNK